MANSLIERIDLRLKKLGKTDRAASIEATGKPDLVRHLRKQRVQNPRIDTLKKLADALETTTDWLLDGDGDEDKVAKAFPSIMQPLNPEQARHGELAVYGLAAGAITGAHALSKEPIDYVTVPLALARARDVYALRVVGESMIPRYFPDDVIIAHPGRPVRQGDHIIIQEERDGETFASVKCFVRKTDSHIITRQYNPEGEVKFNLRYVVYVHRVLTANEILGV